MKKRIISFVLTVVMLLSAISMFAFAAHPTSGSANDEKTASWTFDAATGTVTFTGKDSAGLSMLTTSEMKEIAPKIKKEVVACQRADIVNGYAEGGKTTFQPKKTATRAEAAQILYKFHKDFVAK